MANKLTFFEFPVQAAVVKIHFGVIIVAVHDLKFSGRLPFCFAEIRPAFPPLDDELPPLEGFPDCFLDCCFDGRRDEIRSASGSFFFDFFGFRDFESFFEFPPFDFLLAPRRVRDKSRVRCSNRLKIIN